MYTALQPPVCPQYAQARTHTHTAGTAQGRSRAGARAELILLLGCLEMIQAILAAPRGDIGYLNLTGGGEESLLYFYTFISLHFQQAGTVHLQNHLGKQKDDNFH